MSTPPPPPRPRGKTAARGATLVVAAWGAGVFVALGLPLPFLLGPLFFCLLAALAGGNMAGMGKFGVLMRTILGVAIGSSITPDITARLGEFLLPALMVPLFILVIAALGYPFFRKVCGLDHPTAYYAAMPGGLQDMIVFGEEAGADVRALSLIHATRVLIIVSVAPALLAFVWDLDLTQPPGAPMTTLPLSQMGIMVLSGVMGWKIAERVGMFGASILGPLILTAVLSLSGVIESRPPAEAIFAAQFFIGIAVGARYTGISGHEVRVDVAAGAGYCVILAIVALVFAEVVALTGMAPQIDAFLAFAPGGQAEMVVIALIAGADLAFVVTMHLLRILVVIIGAPLVARLFRR